MSAHPQGGHYDETGGYGHPQHPATDSYYENEHAQPYYDQQQDYPQGQQHGGEGFYDEAYVRLYSRVLLAPLT